MSVITAAITVSTRGGGFEYAFTCNNKKATGIVGGCNFVVDAGGLRSTHFEATQYSREGYHCGRRSLRGKTVFQLRFLGQKTLELVHLAKGSYEASLCSMFQAARPFEVEK